MFESKSIFLNSTPYYFFYLSYEKWGSLRIKFCYGNSVYFIDIMRITTEFNEFKLKLKKKKREGKVKEKYCYVYVY